MAFRNLTLLCIFAFGLTGCAGNWGWYVVDPTVPSGWNNLKFLASGLYYTLLLSFTAILISVVIGLAVALPGLSTRPWLRRFQPGFMSNWSAPFRFWF